MMDLGANKNSGQGLACGGCLLVPVFADEVGQGSSNLALGNGTAAGDLAVAGNAGSHGCDEDVLRCRDLLAVALPLHRRVTASMIGEQDQRGVATVVGIGLNKLPQALQVPIDATGGLKIAAIVARVRPLVGFAERKIKETWMFRLEIFERGVKGGCVEGFVGPDARRLGFEMVE